MMCLGDGINDCNSKTSAIIGRGLFMPMNWKSFATCVDGTSNTIAFSEAIKASGTDQMMDVKGGIVAAGPGLETNSGNRISNCVNQVDPNDKRRIATGKQSRTMRGCVLYSNPMNGGFHTVLPPNSVSCSSNGTVAANAIGNWALLSATSNHSGGVNVGLLDGSVRFVSETIDCGNITTGEQKTSGKSDFGVWGAMGTPNGGESTAL